MKITPAPRPGLTWRVALLLSAGVLANAAFADDATTHRVAGTGTALEAMRLLSEDFSVIEPTARWVVLPSLGTAGGIRALMAGEVDIALAARRPRAEELAKGVQEAVCFRTALVFASSHRSPPGIAKSDLPDLYRSVDRTWPDGMPIKVILRPQNGSENGFLSQVIPALTPALEAAAKRPGMPVGATDQQNAELATRTAGSLAVMTLLQIRSELLNLRVLPLDGILPTPEALENKTYPLPFPICLLTMLNHPPSVSVFVAYLRSQPARTRMRSLGAIAAE